MKPIQKALIVFARYPKIGKVKTRLAQGIGDEQALLFYELCLGNILREAEKLRDSVRLYFFYDDQNDKKLVEEWLGKRFLCRAQVEAGLVERNRASFEQVFAEGATQAVIIATDIPDITSVDLERAFAWLDKKDIVIGPDYEDGYYLLGMREFHEGIFQVTYGKNKGLFSQLLKRFKESTFSYQVLPTLIDIDTLDDLRVWHEKTREEHPVKQVSRLWEREVSTMMYLGQFFRFLLSGGIAALVYFTLLIFCVEWCHFYYMAAIPLSFFCASMSGFILQKFWTFRGKRKKKRASHWEFSSYLLVTLAILVVNMILTFFITEFAQVWYLPVQVVVVGALALVSFFIQKLFIFR